MQCKLFPKYIVSEIAAKSLLPTGKIKRTDENKLNLSRPLITLNLIFHCSNKEDLKIYKMYCVIKVVFRILLGKVNTSEIIPCYEFIFIILSIPKYRHKVGVGIKDTTTSKQVYN